MFAEFKVVFLSIIIEALPFLLIGSLVAAILEFFVSDDFIRKLLPENKFLQIVMSAFFGLIFPICECTIIPIARKLIKKGVPVSSALVFMLATPIINPVPMAATYFAFGRSFDVMIHRVVLGFIVAITVGLMYRHYSREEVLKDGEKGEGQDHNQDHEPGCNCGHAHCNAKDVKNLPPLQKITLLLTATASEFLDVASYLVIGSLIAAAFTVAMPEKAALYFQSNNPAAIFAMETLAYILSLCSHGDAFVAAGLAKKFTFYPILAFLVISPLIDIKNTIILLGLFRKKFSIGLVLRIFIITFLVVLIMSSMGV